MAHKIRFPQRWYELSPNLKNWGFDFMYNIDGSVGLDGTNTGPDVLLVQYLLHYWAHEVSEWASPGKYSGSARDSGLPKIPVDGKFNNITLAYIFHFQMYSYQRVKSLSGRIDPIDIHLPPSIPSNLSQLNVELHEWPPKGAKNYALTHAPAGVRQAVSSYRP